MMITHQGSIEVDERFRKYSHGLLRALGMIRPVRAATLVLEKTDRRYHVEVQLQTSTRALIVQHTAPNMFAAMDICYYDLRKKLAKRQVPRVPQKKTFVQRVTSRITRQ